MEEHNAEIWGKADGRPCRLYTLRAGALTACVSEYGATVTKLLAPDREGRARDILLGYDTLEGYVRDPGKYFGMTVGRYANRIGGARFTLDGREYRLPANNGKNCLHGGVRGFSKRLWETAAWDGERSLTLRLLSPDGEEGFPGSLTAEVRYTLSPEGLTLEYGAVSDADTVVNLTNHAYFNLAGRGDVLGHTVLIHAGRYTPVDAGLIPTGEIAPVEGTPFDRRRERPIGEGMPQGGYDHNLCLDGEGERPAARLADPDSGRALEISTTLPGVQFYTGNFLNGAPGKGGVPMEKHGGVCLETQFWPDSPNRPNFPDCTLRAGRTYFSRTAWRLSAK